MTGEVQRRPTEEAASRSGQDTSDRTAPTLFEPSTTRTPQWTDELHDLDGRRRAGEKAALKAASKWWKEAAEEAIERLAASGRIWTAEDLRAEVGDVPAPSQNAMGAVIAAASRRGDIECVGTCSATRAPANGHVLRKWRGTEVGR